MKKLALISSTFVLGLLACSCSKDSGSAPFDSQIEITFVNPELPYAVTGASVTNTANTWNTKAGETAYETKLTDLAVYVVAGTGASAGKVIYKTVFTAAELGAKRHIFSVDDLPADAVGGTFDFYAFANCGTSFYDGISVGATALSLKDYRDMAVLGDYNDADYAAARDGSGLRAAGMVMAGVSAAVPLSTAGSGPTKPEIALMRTVAKVEVEAYTTKTGEVTSGGSFEERYAGSRVEVISAEIVNAIPGTTLLDQGVNNYKEPSSTTTWSDAVAPTGGQTASGDTQEGGVGNKASNLFYLYPNGGRTATEPIAAYEPVLEIKTKFYIDSNDVTGSAVTYEIPLSGVGDTDGDGVDDGAGMEPKFGLFVRNGHYKVAVAINGLTESEVVADVRVANWDNVTTQTVNIGL